MSTQKGTCWCVVINNPTETDEMYMQVARGRGWKVIGQLEQGESGTPHYQLCVKTPRVRFSAIKKAFPRAHIELARNGTALASYSQKEETRVSELPSQDERFPSIFKTYSLMWEYFTEIQSERKQSLYDIEWSEDEWLIQLDKFGVVYIEKGYHIEMHLVNPQFRSSIKKYGKSILLRTWSEKNMSSTSTDIEDRRTEDSVDVEST